jgi:hypothetical protein
MGKNKITKLFFLLIFLPFFSSSLTNKNIAQVINDYNTYYFTEPSNYTEFDVFQEGNININKTVISYNYQISIKNKSELGKIFFDYQSDFGYLNISFNKGGKKNTVFQSQEKNNFFILDLNDVLNNESWIRDDFVVMNVQVAFDNIQPNFNFDFSLKASLKKSINILEINSEHQILCKTEKVDKDDDEDNKYRCLFVVVNKDNITNSEENEKNLLLFPFINENIDDLNLNIYADYINKTIYDNFDNESLSQLIPNNNSQYKNKIINKTTNFIRIENITHEKYLYVSIETNKETLLEILSQEISENKNAYELTNPKKIQTISINGLNASISLDFTKSDISEYSILLITVYGKSTIYFEDNPNEKYTADVRENSLFLSLDSKKGKLILEKIDEGHVFYITVLDKEKSVINELIYSRASRFSFNNIPEQMLFYENIPVNNDSVNINFQLYNILQINNTFNICVALLSKEEMQEIKYNISKINNMTFIAEGQLSPISLSANIHLNHDLNNENKSNVFIILQPTFDTSNKKMILGISLTKVNSLIYPSERIYYYGELNKYDRVTYKLEGNEKYHLMRLELGHNSGDINWSVKRTYEEKNYTMNDTDLSFVIEYWHNGRELLTMYIENGEDIYLTIFKKQNIRRNKNISYNYVFKYINAGKNGDFKNYVVKQDNLIYNEDDKAIKIYEFWNVHPKNVIMSYYMRTIQYDNYVTSETLNSISLIESKGSFLTDQAYITDEETSENLVEFYLRNSLNTMKSYFLNCYIAVIEDNNNIELLSYEGTFIEGQTIPKPIIGLIIAALCIAGIVFIILVIRFIHHCTCAENYYTVRKRSNYRYNYDYLI